MVGVVDELKEQCEAAEKELEELRGDLQVKVNRKDFFRSPGLMAV